MNPVATFRNDGSSLKLQYNYTGLHMVVHQWIFGEVTLKLDRSSLFIKALKEAIASDNNTGEYPFTFVGPGNHTFQGKIRPRENAAEGYDLTVEGKDSARSYRAGIVLQSDQIAEIIGIYDGYWTN